MKSTLIFLLASVLMIQTMKATHIVGGEIEVIHQRGYTYLLNVKMYVDEIGGKAVVDLETSAIIGIYNKQTNIKIDEYILNKISHKLISYQKACDINQAQQIKTGLIIFSKSVTLPPNKYSSPNGYYIVYENCCRNEMIKNIIGPKEEGMAFYTEFPGVTIQNSSPYFKTLKGDYPCLNRSFQFDFSGTDADGDSLAYSLSTPLAGHLTMSSNQETFPAPYDSVKWKQGYGLLNQIRGNPPLRVNPKTGMLTVTPSEQGLFVFSVNVFEFRKGKRIGMVKRDFQLPVITCPDNAPPAIDLKLSNGTIYSKEKDTLELTIDSDSCFTIIVSDSSTIKFKEKENLTLSVISSNLPQSIFNINSVSVYPGNDTSNVNFCVAPCNKVILKKDSVYAVDIEVSDEPKCPPSLVYRDTLNLLIKFKPSTNHKPVIGILPEKNAFTVIPNKTLSYLIYATDEDKGDMVTIIGQGMGFDLAEKKFSFPKASHVDSASSMLNYTPDCSDLDPGIFKLRFITFDQSCLNSHKDTIITTVTVEDTTTIIDEIQPPNLITPNDDRLNDVFELRNLPRGNCEYFFKEVLIFNRWGHKIYESKEENFQWDGKELPDGLYYYQIDLNKKSIKGWIQIVR